jgi:hypothetical protein
LVPSAPLSGLGDEPRYRGRLVRSPAQPARAVAWARLFASRPVPAHSTLRWIVVTTSSTAARARTRTSPRAVSRALLRWVAVAALCCTSSWLAGKVRAQDTTHSAARGQVQIVYRAPASCPTRDVFERRLEARLRGALPATDRRVVLSVELRAAPHTRAQAQGDRDDAVFLGSISLSDAHGVLGPRAIEAPRCNEALDALTFVAALLLEDHARAAADATPRTRPSTGATSGRARHTSTAATLAPSTKTTSEQAHTSGTLETNDGGEPAAETSTPAPPVAPAAPSASATASSPAPTAPVRADVAPDADGAPDEQNVPPQASSRPMRGSLTLGVLLVSGVAPLLRPGLSLSAGLAAPLGRSFELSATVGLRATLPHQAHSAEGDGTFHWWSSAAALCAALVSSADALRAALCLAGEAGQILATGRATDAPQRVHSTWLALGPAARTSLRLGGPVRLVSGVELLVAGARDRFVVGTRELYRVSRLTFRAELALAVEWP